MMKCPSCESRRLKATFKNFSLKGRSKQVFQCFDCGHTFPEPENVEVEKSEPEAEDDE